MDTLTFEDIKQMFRETDKKFQENEKRWQETLQQIKESDRKFQAIHDELGGIGKSNGQMAEDFFYDALEHSMKVGNIKYDYIDRNTKRKRNNLEGEYDIVLYNDYKVLIVEVKYNFKYKYLRDFYSERLKNFTKLFPQYKDYKIYGAIAAFSFEKEVIKEAEEYGFYVITQHNDKMKVMNKKDFTPNEIK